MLEESDRPRVAVVTGASRGLGAGLATRLEQLGFRVASCATTLPSVGSLVRSVDVADEQSVESFASQVVDQLGLIDLWINNAGVIGPVNVVDAVPSAGWKPCIEVNVMGTLHGCRAFLSRRAGSSILVNIVSRAGVVGVPGLAAYSASKAAVIALTESLAGERLPGVSVVAVVPPSIDTDMQKGLLAQSESTFPGVVQSRTRRDAGAILGVADAARLIVEAVLRDEATPTVLDLTEASTG